MFQYYDKLIDSLRMRRSLVLLIILSVLAPGLSNPAFAIGKPSAPIYITSVKQFSVEPDIETEINVQLDVSHYDSGILAVTLEPDDQIVLVDTDTENEFIIDTNTRQIDIPVKFYATAPGRYYLMLTVALEDENFNIHAKSMGVVINVGSEAIVQKQMYQDVETTTASEDRVKVMQAEEIIY